MAAADLSGHAGVREHFFLVKEEVSSDWKDLAFHLGFERADTDNIAGRNRDDKSRCMDLLEEWLKRNGERATIEVLMEALSEANLQSTVDKLKKITISVSDAVQPQGSQQESNKDSGVQTEQGAQIKHVFQESVKGFYEMKLTKFKPLIWNDTFTLTLGDIFTELELIGTKQKRQEGNRKLHSLNDLFKRNVTGLSKAPRCILIEGEAGGGKTTFLSKEALDAVSQKTELGRRHDIVLLIRLREVREGETIEEMVWDQCVPETAEGIDVQSIRTILQRNESRVLFLLDGYDELRPETRAAGQAIPKLLSGKMYPKSTIVITSRPSAGVQQYSQPDCHENQPVTDLIHTPIFLMLVCLLWEENPDMVSQGTMTEVYSDLLTCLGRKHCKREGVDMPTDGLPIDLAHALLQLGKLALEALLKNETLLEVTEVERKHVNWQLLLNLGVVSLEVSASKLHPRKQLNFSHKTMQEFLAGRYVAHALMNEDFAVELLQLTSITKGFELSTLLQFTCGSDSGAAKTIWQELSKLCSMEFSSLEDIFENVAVVKNPKEDKLRNSYKRFVLLCLDLLTERKDLDVLKAICTTLPIIVLDNFPGSRQRAALKYYLENCPTSCLPDRMILGVCYRDFGYLEETFTNPVPGLRLDLFIAKDPRSPTFDNEMIWLVSVLRNVPCLRALKLPFAELTPRSIWVLVEALSHMPLLEELDLSCNGTIGDEGINILQGGLLKVPHLTVLRLMLVDMTADGISSLTSRMRHLKGLKLLDISWNVLKDKGVESLAVILPTFAAMQVLNLRNTFFSSAGMRTLAPALCHLSGLIKLDISGNEDIRDPGVEYLTAILPHLRALKVLILRQIIITEAGLSALIKVLPVALQVLDVGDNYIAASGIVSLVQTLCQPSGMNMDQATGDQEAMATAPHHSTTLHGLAIGQKIALSQVLPRLPVLEKLELRGTSMEPAGFQAVVQAAEEHPTLESLEYNENCVPAGVDASSRCLWLR
ncbi:hypothetical protein Bbelb_096540 [Branchiostoma belcheri]|nr:hypothetical protein Bbelb_096540 [Branchiostoma belcheri]